VAAFRCEKVFYVPGQDLVALVGAMESGFVRPGFMIGLPPELRGPGWVPIRDVQTVPFRDGRTRLAVLLDYEVLTGAPLMEFSDLEGKPLDVRKP
jgi:hypothetical protein